MERTSRDARKRENVKRCRDVERENRAWEYGMKGWTEGDQQRLWEKERVQHRSEHWTEGGGVCASLGGLVQGVFP